MHYSSGLFLTEWNLSKHEMFSVQKLSECGAEKSDFQSDRDRQGKVALHGVGF